MLSCHLFNCEASVIVVGLTLELGECLLCSIVVAFPAETAVPVLVWAAGCVPALQPTVLPPSGTVVGEVVWLAWVVGSGCGCQL